MTTFKNLKAVFSARGRLYVVERVRGGATPYGDASAHIFKIYNTNENLIETKAFDTRYECITTDIVKWCVYWCNYIKSKYDAKDLWLVSYHSYEEVLKNA